MKKITLSIIAIALLHIAFVQSIQSQSANCSEIDEFILEQMENFHVPGLSACIIIGDSVVWNNSYGYMNLEDSIPVADTTMFNVFSIGKSITAACAMQLWDDGLLGLDQNVNGFLPFQVDNPYFEPDSITPRMLMSHSASISDYGIENLILPGDPTISLAYYVENYFSVGGEYYNASNFYNSQPGLYFHYTTNGPALTGYAVQVLTGIEFHDYAKQSLLLPLEMTRSAWFLSELNIDNLAIGYKYQGGNYVPRPHRGHPAYPGFFLRSNTLELANFTIMLLNNGNFHGQTILSGAAVDSMTTLQNPNWVFSYGRPGLGLFERTDYGDRTVWGHNGGSIGGYAAQIYFCKEENSGVLITTNSEQYVDPIVEYLFDYALIITSATNKLKTDFNHLNIYPNPVKDFANVDLNLQKSTPVTIYIYSLTGICLKTWELSSRQSEVMLDVKDLAPGIYFLRLQAGDRAMVKKIIKVN